MQEPQPEQYNPPLTLLAQVWRTALALAISALVWGSIAPLQWQHHRGLFWLDLSLGVLSLGLSFFRRRWPLPVAVVITLLGVASASAAGPGTLAAASLATRRRIWQVVLVGVLSIGTALVFPMFEPEPNNDRLWVTFTFALVFTIAMLAYGMYVGSRRELLWTLRDRAERAEAEQELRIAQARSNERARIAREMHDVLAHRISLLTIHAGALAYRTDLTSQEIRQTAEIIQSKAHEALTDLRQVLGVLRGDELSPAGLGEQPQPTFTNLSSLIREAEESGMRVQYDDRVLDARQMPDQVGRTTYRIVQEGLTNARKHAPGVIVMVSVGGSPDSGVEIRIRNPARSRVPSSTPGAGLGLIGLTERAMLAGGRLESSREGGTFELHGWLPWAQ